MKKVHLFAIFGLLIAALCVFAETNDGATLKPKKYYGKIAQRMAAMIPQYHVLQRPLNDEISQKAWTNLISFYDFDHSVFLKSDLDALSVHEKTLDDEIRAGDVSFGYEVHRLFCERLKERIDFATNLLATADFKFDDTNEVYEIKRENAPWPATLEEAQERWRLKMKNEMLVQQIAKELDAEEKTNALAVAATNEVAIAEDAEKKDVAAVEGEEKKADEADDAEDTEVTDPRKNLTTRYRQYYIALTEPEEETVLQNYLSAITHAYDPHSDYMSPLSKEDFDMDMNLTLCGVGAVLSMDNGALKIMEVMPGGPMARDGRIKEGDKIVGVENEPGKMENILWKPMNKTIRKIRGKKGTKVTLEVIPRKDTSGATKKRIELIRDEIKLDDAAATGHVERVALNGFTNKVGYVYLPGFYGTMDKNPGDKGFRSCAEDVEKYLGEFNASGVEGLVLDLRGDGGGSLKEAVLLSSLFVSSGPVVLIRDNRLVQPLAIPPGSPVAFDGPMVVLIDRASASASEIVAAHLRDTGRAIVLGDVRTHGKGTVQTVMGMGPEKYGSLKVTTARFYRINGESTQVKGVEADIHLPSILDSLDIGEDKLPNALPFTKILPMDYRAAWNLPEYLPILATNSAARLAKNEKYTRHLEHVKGTMAAMDRTFVSLDYATRKAQMAADRAMQEEDEKENEDEESSSYRRRKAKKGVRNNDVVLDEAYNILADLIRQTKGAKMPRKASNYLDSIFSF